jgi:hypothetical protein
LSIEISVASLTDQRSVADCPRSMELGSAVNCVIVGALGGGGGGGGSGFATGAGGGGGGGFFLQPTMNTAVKITKKQTNLICRLLNINFAS